MASFELPERTKSEIIPALRFKSTTEECDDEEEFLISNCQTISSSTDTESLSCLLCSKEYDFLKQRDDYLSHLYMEHRLVIAEVNDIDLLSDYLRFWRQAFNGHELEEYCTTMLLDQLPDGTTSRNERYYLLSDILPQDRELRIELKRKNVQRALAQHKFELNDRSFKKKCLYCRDVIEGLRSMYLEHLLTKHFLQLGKPENLVFVDELLDKVKTNLDNLICLFCEKVFRDRLTLKEHMRKKGHKRINPSLKQYDRFYLENYHMPDNNPPTNKCNRNFLSNNKNCTQLSHHKLRKYCRNTNNLNSINKIEHKNSSRKENWRQEQNTPNNSSKPDNDSFSNDEENSDADWSDWNGILKQSFNCLYCEYKTNEYKQLNEHIKEKHSIDLNSSLKPLHFYQRIKLVNYIRRQMCFNRCVTCDERFPEADSLQKHLIDKQHFGVGTTKQWDKPEYFFPTYEDDDLLFVLDNLDEDSDESNDITESENLVPIFVEESSVTSINKEAELLSLENFNLLL